MGSIPLHPMLVHLPLALAVLLPPFALVAGVLAWRPRERGRPWLPIPLLALLLFGSGLAASSAGQQDAEAVAEVVPEAALAEHEAWAGRFVWSAAGLVWVALLGLAERTAVRRGAIVLTAILSLALAALAFRTGEAGSALVYRHGAAEAHRPE